MPSLQSLHENGDPATAQAEYLLSDEAFAAESLVVEEVDEEGSVPDLLVQNQGEIPVLFLEGEELVGAKQNRVLNTSVLVAAGSKLKIPVSCVEQGRWEYKTRRFRSSGSHSPSKLRRSLKESVSRAVRDKRGHRSDQNQVWDQVAALHEAHEIESETAAMSDAFENYEERIAEFRERVPFVDGATGLAVAVGGKLVAVDPFDKPSTCQKVWDRLLTGAVFDALESARAEQDVEADDVERALQEAAGFQWEPVDTVGEGEEYRGETEASHASALLQQDAVVHGSLVCG